MRPLYTAQLPPFGTYGAFVMVCMTPVPADACPSLSRGEFGRSRRRRHASHRKRSVSRAAAVSAFMQNSEITQ